MKAKSLIPLTMLFFVGLILPDLVHARANLAMNDQRGNKGDTITFTLSVNGAPNEVAAFGFDVNFNPRILTKS